MAAGIRLYLDENLSPRIAEQLRRRGVDIVTVYDLGVAGDTDESHLERATGLNRVLVTADTDFWCSLHLVESIQASCLVCKKVTELVIG